MTLSRLVQAAISDPVEAMSEKVLGKEDAPITIIEYASLTCHHCAAFHAEVLPKLKDNYIETGKVRLIYRDFPLDQYALKAAVLARCAGKDHYFSFLDVLFQKQAIWALGSNPIPALQRIAKFGGINAEDFKQCLNNRAIEEGILDMRLQAEKAYKISSTPTIYINGEKYEGKHSFEALDETLRKLLPDS
jgi:protein-disulfide isomerase